MKRLQVGPFILLLLVSFLLMLIDQSGMLNFFKRPFETVLLPVQTSFSASSSFFASTIGSLLGSFEKDKRIADLENENRELLAKLVALDETKKERDVLKEQLGIRQSQVRGVPLIEAKILGRPGDLILDKGTSDGVKEGDIVLVKDSVVGKVSGVSERLSKVTLISSPKTTVAARALGTGAIGSVRSDISGTVIFDNVTLDQKLDEGDFVVTKGDFDPSNTSGFPPGYVLGTVQNVERRESELFQKAKLSQPFDVHRLRFVFVLPVGK